MTAASEDALIAELSERIVSTLGLEDVEPAGVDPDAPLFGGPEVTSGLGLDSIDALELVVMVEKHYGIRLQDMETSRQAFASVRALARFVTERRAAE